MSDEIDNKKFAERLNQAFDLCKYPPHRRGRVIYIQEIFNISRAGANKWIHGKVIPHPQKRIEIANKLGISLDWLEKGIGSPLDRKSVSFESSQFVHKIPLISMKHAYNFSEEDKKEDIEWLVVNKNIPVNSIAIHFIGSSMQPRFQEPSILIIDRDECITDGDYVLAKTKIMPEAILRQYIKGSSSNYLIALNSKFDVIEIDINCQIIGKVIEIRNES